MKKLFIVPDLDDTLFETELAMTHWINETFTHNLVWKNRLSRTDPKEAPYLMEVLKDGRFMEEAEWCPGFEHFPQLKEEMKTVFGDRIEFIFCTHRGYHENAPVYTRNQFKRLGLEMEGVFLDPEYHPCKKTWLDANLQGADYYLFDDNPHWVGGERGDADNIFLMDKLWNQNETQYPRIFNYDQFKQTIFDLAIKHLT